MENESNSSKLIENFNFIATAVIVPILIGITTSYISFKMDKPREYLVRETFNLEKLDVTKYFPLKTGNYWIYSRDMSFNNGHEDEHIEDEVKVEVIDHYENGDSQLFVIKGNPIIEGTKEANNYIYGYIVVSNKIIIVPNQKINLFIEKFKNKEGIYADDTNVLSVEYEFPLYDGQKYGDITDLFRADAKNISHVTKLVPYRKKVGENIMDIGNYKIDNLYNSGDEQKIFTPYLGITEMSYEHRGTTDKYTVDLKEYKIKED